MKTNMSELQGDEIQTTSKEIKDEGTKFLSNKLKIMEL